ncbi:probable membrane-associated kinase regulator 1 [Phtheirospermum japonicum]|uniref:Probable membrane-associated kinase regulator 1 n=1 Tax=Phtheirospermum japonicum TaxID=374723 RepID=A0A830B9R6_9LAMI|nr:probable membrane-associated kinase regulator 1 [Phtheirospermum japonicum]
MIRKYLKKVKPLYEKLSQKQKMSPPPPSTPRIFRSKSQEFNYPNKEKCSHASVLHSFSGNLRLYYPRTRSNISSCPSSMRSSPSHGRSGSGYGFGSAQMGRAGMYNSDASSMEELQNAIQGAIAHCKNSMLQNKAMVSDEI